MVNGTRSTKAETAKAKAPNGKSQSSKQKQRSLKPLARLFPYLKRYKLHVSAALFFLLLAAATTLTIPLAVRRVVDHGFSNKDSLFIDNYFSMLVVITAVLALASSCRYYFVIWLGERVVSDIRSDVFAHVTRLSADFFDTAQTGEIISRLTADTTQIKSAVGATTSMALRNTLLGIGALIMMVYSAPGLSLIVIGAIPVIVLPIIAFGRAVRRRSRSAQDTLADATAYASESISAVRTMQAFSNEELVRGRFSQAVEHAFEAARLAIRTRALLTAMAIFLIFSSVVAVMWFGAQDVLAGKMTAGALGQFLLYAVFAAGALGALSEVWGELSQAAGAAERIAELLIEEPTIRAPENPKLLASPLQGEIAFEKVSFAYPTRTDMPVLDELSQSIRPGETVAIVGSSGAGKSTIFSLLLRFYDPDSGKITLDGTDIRELDPMELRKSIGFVPQETIIFAASAYENIAYGNPAASREAVMAAAQAANAHEFIEQLSNGYETELGERGVMLSGGQRQRLAIARAILKDAPILLLDEATSALDAESEKLVQDALDKLMDKRTTLIIAHRLATILKADRILVMDKGQVVEEGNHKKLVKKNGIYARLARLQFDVGAEAMRETG
ncbi:MAG: ATP-binding cassette domain-containing protein [Rhizobiaceae bacterium]|nr:ATP-binding cassette domain-containing protein [Rhizobiaceae bacterium]